MFRKQMQVWVAHAPTQKPGLPWHWSQLPRPTQGTGWVCFHADDAGHRASSLAESFTGRSYSQSCLQNTVLKRSKSPFQKG